MMPIKERTFPLPRLLGICSQVPPILKKPRSSETEETSHGTGGNLEPSSGQIPRPHRRHRFGHPVKSHHLRSCRWFACQMPIAEPTKIPYKGKKSATGTYWNHLEPSTSPIPGSKMTFHFISWYLSCPSLSQISGCTSRLYIQCAPCSDWVERQSP